MLSLWAWGIQAQTPYIYSNGSVWERNNFRSDKEKYFGADLNPILSSFLPFNGLSRNSPLTLVQRTYWDDNGVRIGFGLNTEAAKPFFSFEIGYDKRRVLDESDWCFFKGFEGGINIFENKSSGLLGRAGWVNGAYLSAHYGVEYLIDSRLSVSTEVRLGLYTGTGLRILPPTNFIFHLRL